jgi:DNA (cytosine-5)-methyltransferase 1
VIVHGGLKYVWAMILRPHAKPGLIDLFSGGGGCGVGYSEAGFEVMGVDTVHQINYPLMFVQADALTYPLDHADVVHASPPCQRWVRMARGEHPDPLTPTRERLRAWGGPYVIENVPGAPLIDPVMICGAALGLGAVCNDGVYRVLRRHRMFESNLDLRGTGCGCGDRPIIGVYGHGSSRSSKRGYQGDQREREAAMDMDWMTTRELSQSIPSRYSRFLGEQILELIS